MASRRPPAAAAALLAAVALAACSTGVPPTGKVVTVNSAAVPPRAHGTDTEGSGPRPGSSETEVAQGFMTAMGYGNLHAAARWVIPTKAEQISGWSSGGRINVYSTFDASQPTTENGRRVVSLRVRQVGRLEVGRDWVPDARDRRLDLELHRVGSEWRVANPTERWVEEGNFKKQYGPVDMFMLAADRAHLTPVSVFVPRPPVSNALAALEQRGELAIRSLLEGPRGRLTRNLRTAIPPGTRLLGFSYRGGVVTVDLSAEFAAVDALSGRFRVGQIVWTVTRLIQTAQVRILVDGRPAEKLGRDDFRAARLWQRTMGEMAGLWPQRSTVTGADSVLFVRKGEIWSVRPEANQEPSVLPFAATGEKSGPTWSPNHRRIAFLLADEASPGQGLWIGEPGKQALPAGLHARRLSPPSWSPDSNQVYTLSRTADGQTRLNRFSIVNWANEEVELPPLPGNRRPTLIEVSPDGAFVLALGVARRADPQDGGQLYLGVLGPRGVTDWSPNPIAPGLGDLYSPVWVDPLTVAFIAQTDSKDDLGTLRVMKSDGWDPTSVINGEPSENAVHLGNQLTVDPAGANFVFTVRSESGTSLWMVARQGGAMRPLTVPTNNDFVTDPSFASR